MNKIFIQNGGIVANNRDKISYKDLKAGFSFYIHDEQRIEIQGIPSGLGYTITETPEDYLPSAAMDQNGDIKTNDKGENEGTDINDSGEQEVEIKGETTTNSP